jgi:hypothetical protein
MPHTNLSQRVGFRRFTKVALGVFLLLVIFAPITNVLGTPVVAVAHAQTPTFCSQASTCLTSVIYLLVVYLPTNFAYVAGYIFNFGVQLALNSASYGLDFLSQGWAVVRDIANLSFIFILIYIAYTVIMEAETTGTMRMLAGVIVMALLINFSFFLTRVVVDAGNILAVQFYNAIDIKDPTNKNAPTPVIPSPINSGLPGQQVSAVKDLSAGVMNALQVQKILSSDSFDAYMKGSGSGIGTFLTNVLVQTLVYVAVGIFLMVIAFIFLLMGVKFLIRIITLWFAIIASPLAFAAQAVPNKKISGYYHLWLTHLIESSLYPAVFLFLFFIITQFLNTLAGPQGIVPSIFAANAFDPNSADIPGFVAIIANIGIRLGLITVLLYYAMKFSDKFSEESGNAARSAVSWAGNRTASITGWTARNTVGRGANAAANSRWVQDKAANSVFGRPLMASLKGVAGSSLDVRGVSGLKSLAKTTGIDLNNAPKTSFIKQVENRAKNVETRAKELKGGAVEIDKEQKAFQEKYDKDNGSGAYTARVAALTREKKDAETRAKTAKDTGNKEVAKQASAAAKEAEGKIKDLTEAGKKKIDSLNDERKARYLARLDKKYWANAGLGPSRGTIEGISKVRGGKSPHDELLEAAEKVRKEHEEEHGGHDGGDDDHTPDGGGSHTPTGGGPRGNNHSEGGGTTAGPAGAGHDSNHGGTHASNESPVTLSKESMEKLVNRMHEVVSNENKKQEFRTFTTPPASKSLPPTTGGPINQPPHTGLDNESKKAA